MLSGSSQNSDGQVRIQTARSEIRSPRSEKEFRFRLSRSELRFIQFIQVRKKIPTLRRGHQVGNQMGQVHKMISGKKKTGRLAKRDTLAELMDHLHPKLVPRFLRGSWQGRRQGVNGSLERTPMTSLTQHTLLPSAVRFSTIKNIIKPSVMQDRGCFFSCRDSKAGGAISQKSDSSTAWLPRCRCYFAFGQAPWRCSGFPANSQR